MDAVKITFQVTVEAVFTESVFVVGNCSELGEWDPQYAVLLEKSLHKSSEASK